MQKRKERSEVKATEELGNAGELRSIVADAKAAAAQEELEFRRRTSSTGKKIITIGAPATKPRPKSFAGPETKPRKDSEAERKSSGEESFNTEFIPPPPLLDSEDQPTSGEANSRVRDDVDESGTNGKPQTGAENLNFFEQVIFLPFLRTTLSISFMNDTSDEKEINRKPIGPRLKVALYCLYSLV